MRRSMMVMRSIVPDKGAQSAWQLARRSEIKMPCVILVSPFVDGNVGSVSRCMLNWGLSELRIGKRYGYTVYGIRYTRSGTAGFRFLECTVLEAQNRIKITKSNKCRKGFLQDNFYPTFSK